MTGPTPLKDAIADIGKDGDHFDLTAGLAGDKATVGVEGHKDIGKPGGWALGGAWQWTKGVGSTVLGKLTWRPGGRR